MSKIYIAGPDCPNYELQSLLVLGGGCCKETIHFRKARISLNEKRVLAFDDSADLESLRTTLAAIPIICEGGVDAGSLGQMPIRERFHWLTAPRSSSVQTSPVHTGRCRDLAAALDDIFDRMVK